MIMMNREMKRFNYLTSEIDALYHEAAVKLGISDSALQILYTVCSKNGAAPDWYASQNPGEPGSLGQGEKEVCLISDVCRLTGTSRQTINSALRKLEKEGILYLKPYKGKHKSIHLTKRGEALAAKTAMKLIEMENRIFDAWPEENIRLYLSLTQEYLNLFQNELQQI